MCDQPQIPFEHSNYFRTIFKVLAFDVQNIFLEWCGRARQIPGGAEVTQNILMENELKKEVFIAFIKEIASSYRANECPQRVYDKACKNLLKSHPCFLKGRVSDIDENFNLYRIEKLKDIQAMIAEALQEPDRKTAWEDYRRYDSNIQQDILRQVVFRKKPAHIHDKPIWSYHGESNSDPLEGYTAAQHLDYLGIPHEWEYSRSSSQDENSAWKLSYRLCRTINRYIPTFADTFTDTRPNWNPHFQINERMEPYQYGRTRPIGEFLGHNGIPETVHRRWDNDPETEIQTSYIHSLDFPG